MGKASCHTCVYACWDLGQALLGMSTGFASRPMCANQPEAPGRMRPTPVGNTCRNYHPKPATPEGDVKRIPLAGGSYAYVDAADYEWLSKYSWHVYAGGYAARHDKGKTLYMHREIMKPPEGMVVDHIDGNKGNNCRFNLRVCTPAQNRRNHAKHAQRSSRYMGVCYVKDVDKYRAAFHFNGETLRLGYFDDEVEAARARDHKAVEYDGPFARLNFPEEWPPERIRQVHADAQARLKEGRREGKKVRTTERKRPGGRETTPYDRTRGRRTKSGSK